MSETTVDEILQGKEEREEDVGIREILKSFKKSSKGLFLMAQW